MNTTVSVENNNQKKWEPNREGLRFKDWIQVKKEDSFDVDEKEISDQASLILSKCINPNEYKEINLESTGLVIGQVQSGKTLSMTSVAAMAKDNGFGIVIVMSGAVTPLSFQTAERIATELKGRRIIKIINNPRDSWGEQDANKVKNLIENYKDKSIPEERRKTHRFGIPGTTGGVGASRTYLGLPRPTGGVMPTKHQHNTNPPCRCPGTAARC